MKQFQSTKGGESLPLAPKQSCLSATPSSGDTPQRPDKKEESRQNTSFRLFQFTHKIKFYYPLEFPGYYDSAVAVVSMIQFLFACNINIHSFAICFKTWNYALIVMLPTVDFHKIHQCAVCTWNC